jgi:hypothetical protein
MQFGKSTSRTLAEDLNTKGERYQLMQIADSLSISRKLAATEKA